MKTHQPPAAIPAEPLVIGSMPRGCSPRPLLQGGLPQLSRPFQLPPQAADPEVPLWPHPGDLLRVPAFSTVWGPVARLRPQCPGSSTFHAVFSHVSGGKWAPACARPPTRSSQSTVCPPSAIPPADARTSLDSVSSLNASRHILLALISEHTPHPFLSTSTTTSHLNNPKSFAPGNPAPAHESPQRGDAVTVCVGSSHSAADPGLRVFPQHRLPLPW